MSYYIKENREIYEERCKRAGETIANKHYILVYDSECNLIEKLRQKDFRKKYPDSLLRHFKPGKAFTLGPCKYPEYKGWYIEKIKL